MDSILTSIKKLLGIAEDYEFFDTDIITFINSSLSVLTQLGVGPEGGFVITGKGETWSDFISDETKFELAKSYIYMKVRLLFDPPSNSSVLNSFNTMISEFEWRLTVNSDEVLNGGVTSDE